MQPTTQDVVIATLLSLLTLVFKTGIRDLIREMRMMRQDIVKSTATTAQHTTELAVARTTYERTLGDVQTGMHRIEASQTRIESTLAALSATMSKNPAA